MSELKDEEKQKILIYTAANLFVGGMTRLDTIASRIGISHSALTDLVNSPEWEQALVFWGAEVSEKRNKPEPPDNTPHTLREEYLLKKAFPQPQDSSLVRFVTYDGFIDAQVTYIHKYIIGLKDDKALQKINILLVFPKDKMFHVKRGIKRRQAIAEMNLQPISRRQDRQGVVIQCRFGDTVECVMRNGLVIRGIVVWRAKYTLILRVGGEMHEQGKVVIVYKHGVYEFRVIESKIPSAPRVLDNDDFDDDDTTNLKTEEIATVE